MQKFWCGKCKKSFCVEKPIVKKVVSCPLCKVEVSNSKSERVPYEDIKNLWNEICKSYPRVVAITEKRKVSVKCRWEQLKEIRVFEDAFRKLEASDFCKGINIRGWRASFDWIMANDTNIIKVLEGNYANSGSKKSRKEIRDLNYLVE